MATFQRGIIIDVQGLDEIMDFLDQIDPKDAKGIIKKANAEGAKYLKPKLQAETPWPSYKKAVRRGPAKRDKPAAIVKYDPKRAPFRHIMVGGSKDHSTKRVRAGKNDLQIFEDGGITKYSRGHDVRGVKADHTVRRTADKYGDAALDRVEEYLVRAFGLDE